MAHIHIIEAETSPVRLTVNGRTETIIVGVDTTIDDRFIPSLGNCDPTIRWRFVGDAPAVAPDVVLAAEAEGDLGPDFDAEAVIEGTVPEVAERLEALTPVQLEAVRRAEADREMPRAGVAKAIDKAIAATN